MSRRGASPGTAVGMGLALLAAVAVVARRPVLRRVNTRVVRVEH